MNSSQGWLEPSSSWNMSQQYSRNSQDQLGGSEAARNIQRASQNFRALQGSKNLVPNSNPEGLQLAGNNLSQRNAFQSSGAPQYSSELTASGQSFSQNTQEGELLLMEQELSAKLKKIQQRRSVLQQSQQRGRRHSSQDLFGSGASHAPPSPCVLPLTPAASVAPVSESALVFMCLSVYV